MEIPQTFKLGNTKYTIMMRPRVGSAWLGECVPWSGYIGLSTHDAFGGKRTPKAISETFWHEATHAILYEMDDTRWRDEKFVDAFAKKLNQLVWSARFE